MYRTRCIRLVLLVAMALCGLVSAAEPGRKASFLYVASSSPKDGNGISVTRFDRMSGGLGKFRPTGGLESAGTLAVHPSGKFLYAITRIKDAQGSPTGGVVALTVDDATGDLREIDRRPSGGTGPCYLAVDNDGQCLVVAHCGTASVVCLKLQPDGRFGDASTVIRHEGKSLNSEGKPQAHSINVAPGNRFAIAADLGLDRLFVYRLDATKAQLTPHDPPYVAVSRGAGPRHLAFHPNERYAYSVNELGNTVTACTFQSETGLLHTFQEVATLPGDFRGESYAAEIQVHPTGRFLYASNRGHDSLAIFSIDPKSGRLSPIGHASTQGKFPRHFALDPAGEFLIVANQKSDRLVVFQIDRQTGLLKAKGSPISIPQPVCVRFR